MHIQLPEDLSRIQEVLVVIDPINPRRTQDQPCVPQRPKGRAMLEEGEKTIDALLSIERQERQVQQDGNPVSVDDEEEGQEGVNGGFGDDVGVQAVAEVDGVDVVTVEKSQSANLSSLHLHQVVIPESRSMFTMAAHWNAQSLNVTISVVLRTAAKRGRRTL